VIISAFNLIDTHHIKQTWRGKDSSRLVLGVTFIAVLFLPLQISIYLGTFLSIGIFLFESSRLKLKSLVINGNGEIHEHNFEDIFLNHSKTVIVNVEGDLYFAAVEDLERQINRVFEANTKVLILRLRRMRLIASTGITALEGLLLQAKNNGTVILFSGISKDVSVLFRDCGLEENIGKENIFLATEVLYQSTYQALSCSNGIR
jgi:SulP family sulfate permease